MRNGKRLGKDKNFLFAFFAVIKFKIFVLILLSVLLTLLELLTPYIDKQIVNKGLIELNKNLFIKLLLISTVVNFLHKGISFGVTNFYNILANKLIKKIKVELVSRITKMSLMMLDSKSDGYLQARFNEVEELNSLFSPLVLRLFISAITMIGALIYLINLNIIIFIIILSTMPLIFIIGFQAARKVGKISEIINEKKAELSGEIQETISAVDDLKQLNKSSEVVHKISKDVEKVHNSNISRSTTVNGGNTTITFICSMIQLLVTYIVGVQIMDVSMTLGDYISITKFVSYIFTPMILASNLLLTIKPAWIAMKRINDFFGIDISDNNGNGDIIKEIEQIEFRNVEFSYNKNFNVLANMNFQINKGEKVLIKGSNGTGKTTIVRLLLGLLKTDAGQILYNGKDIFSYDISSIREHIGVISQDSYLFSGTIMENLVCNTNDIDKWNEIKESSIFNGVDWSNGKVISNGKNISNGQKQKIVIARTMIRNPGVIIIDEGVSNLDIQSQMIIKESINTVFKENTCIIITHSDLFDGCETLRMTIDNKMMLVC